MKIIYFDGVCGLCNGFVDFILKVDHQKIFHFSPLQSEYALEHLPLEFTQELSSVVVQMNGQTLSKSKAVMAVFRELGGVWKLLSYAGVLPEKLTNKGYDLVAKHRYKLFGEKETCRLPTPEERERFIL